MAAAAVHPPTNDGYPPASRPPAMYRIPPFTFSVEVLNKAGVAEVVQRKAGWLLGGVANAVMSEEGFAAKEVPKKVKEKAGIRLCLTALGSALGE
eukprot:gene33888-16743_t